MRKEQSRCNPWPFCDVDILGGKELVLRENLRTLRFNLIRNGLKAINTSFRCLPAEAPTAMAWQTLFCTCYRHGNFHRLRKIKVRLDRTCTDLELIIANKFNVSVIVMKNKEGIYLKVELVIEGSIKIVANFQITGILLTIR